MFLEAVAQLQQVLAVAAEFTSHPGRGFTRGHAVEDQQDLRRAAVRALQDGAGEGVEDTTAVATLVVQDRLATAAVDPQTLLLAAPGTG